jgi:hypothetical protein
MARRSIWGVAVVLAVVTGWTSGAEPQRRSAEQPARAAEETADKPAIQRLTGQDASESPAFAPRNPRVLFITKKGCVRCARELARLRKPGGDFAAMKTRGWMIGEGPENHVQIVDRDAIPELVEELEVREFPTVACVNDGEIVRSFKHGCTTPLDAWTFGFLLKGKDERPPGSMPEKAIVETTGSYRLRGNHWSVDSDWNPTRDTVISHLRGPNHGAQIEANWKIESWSYEELRSLHDDLHEQELAATGGSYSGDYQSGGAGSSGGGSFGATGKILGR